MLSIFSILLLLVIRVYNASAATACVREQKDIFVPRKVQSLATFRAAGGLQECVQFCFNDPNCRSGLFTRQDSICSTYGLAVNRDWLIGSERRDVSVYFEHVSDCSSPRNLKPTANRKQKPLVVPVAASSQNTWTKWTEWSECSVTCGVGRKVRNRKCVGCSDGKDGIERKVGLCQMVACPKTSPGDFNPNPLPSTQRRRQIGQTGSMVSGGGTYTGSAGGGTHTGGTITGGGTYTGGSVSGGGPSINPYGSKQTGGSGQGGSGYGSWSQWSNCPQQCTNGAAAQQQRSRQCGSYRGCSGAGTDSRQCPPCTTPSSWSTWSEWGYCSVTCSDGGFTGYQTRTRTCYQGGSGTSTGYGGTAPTGGCSGPSSEDRGCLPEPQPCAPPATWSEWSSYGGNTQTCTPIGGVGPVCTKTRYCSVPGQCPGPPTESGPCPNPAPPCAEWSSWGPWSPPSVSCVSANQYGQAGAMGTCERTRNCQGGNYCEGPSTSQGPCQGQAPRCSEWSQWGPWSGNERTCVPYSLTGTQNCRRSRNCQYGSQCQGSSNYNGPCPTQVPQCPSTWSTWSVWSSCSSSCGTGQSTRSRTCPGGGMCNGQGYDSTQCNYGPCQPIEPVVPVVPTGGGYYNSRYGSFYANRGR